MEFTIHYLASIQSQKRPNCLRRLIVNIYFGEGPAVGVIVCILLCLTNTPSDIIGKIVFPFQRNAFSSGDRLFWWTSINLVIGWLVKVPSHQTLERRKEELWEFLQAPDERMCMYKYCQSWYLIVYNWNRNACPNKQLYFEPVCRYMIRSSIRKVSQFHKKRASKYFSPWTGRSSILKQIYENMFFSRKFPWGQLSLRTFIHRSP